MTNQKPELEVRRKMLEQMRDNFRAQGFEAEMNVQAISVQVSSDGDSEGAQEKMLSSFRSKAENCYKSAEALQGQLAKLPKAKPEKDKQ